MKKQTYVFTFIIYLLTLTIVSSFIVMRHKEARSITISSYEPRLPLPKPMIIEKQVEKIVYVEKIPDPEPEPTPVVQPINEYFDISVKSNYTRDDLIRSLGGIRQGIVPYIDAIVAAEQYYGINSLYILATLGYESGWGIHESGLNNISGWKINGRFHNFESREDCISTMAEGLSNSFIPRVGTSLGDVTRLYCPDPGYTDTVLTIMYELNNNL